MNIELELYNACCTGDLERVKKAIESGADVNWRNDLLQSPLHVAARKGILGPCEALIDAGSNINVVDAEGWTPLHYAIDKGHIDVCKQLIEAGVDVDGGVDMLPLKKAEMDGQTAICELLRASGAVTEKYDPVTSLLSFLSKVFN